MASPHRGFTDKVRTILEREPGKLHDVTAINAALGDDAPEERQPIYNALHELTKTGEVRRMKKTQGPGSVYYWPNDPDEHQQHALSVPGDGASVVRAAPALRSIRRPKDLAIERDPVEDQKPPPAAIDRQEGGSHYKDCPIQPIQYIQANGIGFCEGNVIKYITSWKQKNGIEDLRKARHYIDLLIEHEESAT